MILRTAEGPGVADIPAVEEATAKQIACLGRCVWIVDAHTHVFVSRRLVSRTNP
jgi:hypothetical protein